MTHATHTNTDVLNQLRAGLDPAPLPLVLGGFRHKETDNFFEYSERRWLDASFAPDMPHVVYVGFGDTRLAHVLKTVAYVVVDEDDNGPVIEKWAIKQHGIYNTGWVRP